MMISIDGLMEEKNDGKSHKKTTTRKSFRLDDDLHAFESLARSFFPIPDHRLVRLHGCCCSVLSQQQSRLISRQLRVESMSCLEETFCSSFFKDEVRRDSDIWLEFDIIFFHHHDGAARNGLVVKSDTRWNILVFIVPSSPMLTECH